MNTTHDIQVGNEFLVRTEKLPQLVPGLLQGVLQTAWVKVLAVYTKKGQEYYKITRKGNEGLRHIIDLSREELISTIAPEKPGF